MSEASHANAHATAAMSTVRISGDTERPYREVLMRSRCSRRTLGLAAVSKIRDRASYFCESLMEQLQGALAVENWFYRARRVGIGLGETGFARVRHEGGLRVMRDAPVLLARRVAKEVGLL